MMRPLLKHDFDSDNPQAGPRPHSITSINGRHNGDASPEIPKSNTIGNDAFLNVSNGNPANYGNIKLQRGSPMFSSETRPAEQPLFSLPLAGSPPLSSQELKEIAEALSKFKKLVTILNQSSDVRDLVEEKLDRKTALWEKLKKNEAVIEDREKRRLIPDHEIIPKLEQKNDKLWDRIGPVERSLGKLQNQLVGLELKSLALTEGLEQNSENLKASLGLVLNIHIYQRV
ncbi:MAG: hypothetical protein Q9190_008077 [Brigantiaea leucoxantha]